MDTWNKLKTVPKEAKKKIKGGRIAGMTDIRPQWRLQVMTEVFGVCGIGWKYAIDKMWTEHASENQTMCFVNISLFLKVDGEWSEPIPGTGGNMLVTKESKGYYSSDEGYKMALTDALSVAMKAIGVGADVYMGNAESKYSQPRSSTLNNAKKNVDKPDDPIWDKLLKARTVVGDDAYNQAKVECNFVRVTDPADAYKLLLKINENADKADDIK